MTDDEEHYVNQLQGRVLACETVIRGLLVFQCLQARPDDPVGLLDGMEKGLVRGMQHATFETDDGDGEIPPEAFDIIWETAGQSIRLQFQNAREKLQAATKSNE